MHRSNHSVCPDMTFSYAITMHLIQSLGRFAPISQYRAIEVVYIVAVRFESAWGHHLEERRFCGALLFSLPLETGSNPLRSLTKQ